MTVAGTAVGEFGIGWTIFGCAGSIVTYLFGRRARGIENQEDD